MTTELSPGVKVPSHESGFEVVTDLKDFCILMAVYNTYRQHFIAFVKYFYLLDVPKMSA